LNEYFAGEQLSPQTMSAKQSADVAIVGGGIVGLAHALAALKKGLRVVLFEREQFSIGASVRNFGLLWPIGQEPGPGLRRALRSREIWNEVSEQAGIWLKPNGSLHLAYNDDEWDVLNEFADMYKDDPYDVTLLNPNQAVLHSMKSKSIKTNLLKGVLWSTTEATVNPREAIRRIPLWLTEKYGLVTRFGSVVTSIEMPNVKTATESWKVDKVFVCSGADFETLYPGFFNEHKMVKCKLQMMKAVTSRQFDLGPSLCAGLTLRHYAAFRKCPSLAKVDARYDESMPDYKKDGIHVLVSQNNQGELIIGDSHHYGKTMEPFDSEKINQVILDYLRTFVDFEGLQVVERWNGVYPKTSDGSNLIVDVERDVKIVNGLGGAGMTLSFGLADEIIAETL
jgi:FAD dependent oxidoreductase TIGR03364